MFKKSGFTLIELVIVIILLGILAATAIPKFIGNDGFEGQAYRDQLLQLLKTVQQQAMSCDDDCRKNEGGDPRTSLYACNKVRIESGRFGIPGGCGSYFPSAGYDAPHLGMSQAEADATSIRFSIKGVTLPVIIDFDFLGIPSGCVGCDIDIENPGQQSSTIRIESQGYIHEI